MKKPMIIIKVSGGRVQGVVSSHDADVLVLDYDVDGVSATEYEDAGIHEYPEFETGETDPAEGYEEPPLVDADYALTLYSIFDS